jgi:cytochrome c-type biogenesis protein CcmI
MSSGILFWLIAFVLVVATLAVLVVPLLRRSAARTRPVEADAATAIYRDQSRQLDDDVATGVVNADERERAHEEIVARLGDELAVPPRLPSPRAARRAIAAIASSRASRDHVARRPCRQPAGLDAGCASATPFPRSSRWSRPRRAHEVAARRPRGYAARPVDSAAAVQGVRRACAAARLPNDADVLADGSTRDGAGRTSSASSPSSSSAFAIDPKHPKASAPRRHAMERRDDATAIRHWNALPRPCRPTASSADARETIAQLGKAAASLASNPTATHRAARGASSLRLRSRRGAAAGDAVRVRARSGSRMPLARSARSRATCRYNLCSTIRWQWRPA